MDAPMVMKPKTWLKPPRHSRTRFDRKKLLQLSANIEANGMICAIEALPTGEIISGHRRWLASMETERITEVPVRIITAPLTDRDIRVRRVSENLQRIDTIFYDKYLECRGFQEEEPGISAREIAEVLQVDASTVTRYLCLDHAIDEVKIAAKDNRIGMKLCYEIAKEPPEQQFHLLAQALYGGAKQVALAKKMRNGTVAASRVKRIKVAMASSFVTLESETELGLEEAAQELADMAADMKKAKVQGHDVKTYMALCRKRAADARKAQAAV